MGMPARDADAEPVVLDVVGSEQEAEVISGLLRSEGIESAVRRTDFAAGMADGFPSAAGPREIVVHARDLVRAREILERPEPA
jgi:Putative prokaryotic signal transducing protein